MMLKKDIVNFLKKENIHAAGLFSFDDQKNSVILEKDLQAFEDWLAQDLHGEMKFLERHLHVRKDPKYLLKNLKNVLIFLFPYATGHRVRSRTHKNIEMNEKEKHSILGKKQISRYVFGKDYHRVLKKCLEDVAQKLQKFLKKEFSYRPVVDVLPFLERAYGREAHLGFVGKNTMLIRPGLGSFFFIASLLTDLDTQELVEPTVTNKKFFLDTLDCGDCTKCLDACPTGAFVAPYRLDAKRCLSYLTIEHRDLVPNDFLPFLTHTLYGCDVCQEVCPYNLVTSDFQIIKQFAQYHLPFLSITVEDVALMSPQQYEKWFGGTAATRAKYQGLVRNALYLLYATHNAALEEILLLLEHSPFELVKKTVHQIRQDQKKYKNIDGVFEEI